MFHEACGHGLEADLVNKAASVFAGQSSASRWPRRWSRWWTTARWVGRWGAYAIDDEGRPAQRNVLISDGVLTDFMWDLLRGQEVAQLNNERAARATSTDELLTNTYLIRSTKVDPDDIVADTPATGVYIAHLRWGPHEDRCNRRRLRLRYEPGKPT